MKITVGLIFTDEVVAERSDTYVLFTLTNQTSERLHTVLNTSRLRNLALGPLVCLVYGFITTCARAAMKVAIGRKTIGIIMTKSQNYRRLFYVTNSTYVDF
jgi:hypothetical protein